MTQKTVSNVTTVHRRPANGKDGLDSVQPNLLRNSHFKGKSLNGYYLYSANGTGEWGFASETFKDRPVYAMKHVQGKSDRMNVNGNDALEVALEPGASYTLSVYYKSTVPFRLLVGSMVTTSKYEEVPASADWARAVITFTVKNGYTLPTNVNGIAIVHCPNSTAYPSGDIMLAMPKLEKSDHVTDWCPSASDQIGEDGEPGRSIVSTDTMFCRSAFGTEAEMTASSPTWQNTCPAATEAEQYVWKRVVINYSSGMPDVSFEIVNTYVPGVPGVPGARLVPNGAIETGNTFVRNENVVLFGTYQVGAVQKCYILKANGSVTVDLSNPDHVPYNPESSTPHDSNIWEAIDGTPDRYMVAGGAYIKVLNSGAVYVGEDDIKNGVFNGWLMTHGSIKHTKTGLELTADGRLNDPDGLHIKVGKDYLQSNNLCKYDFVATDVEHAFYPPMGGVSYWMYLTAQKLNSPNNCGILYVSKPAGSSDTTVSLAETYRGDLPLQNGKTYAVSALVAANTTAYSFVVDIISKSTGASLLGSDALKVGGAGCSATQWTKRSASFTCNVDDAALVLKGQRVPVSMGSSYWYALTDLCVTEGSTVKDWSPYIERNVINGAINGAIDESEAETARRLLATGIDIEHRKIRLVADMLECINNSGERTMWLDQYGDLTTSGRVLGMLQEIDMKSGKNSHLIIPDIEGYGNGVELVGSGVHDYHTWHSLDVLNCGNSIVLKNLGTSMSLFLPFYVTDRRSIRTYVRGIDGTPRPITRNDLLQLVGKEINIYCDFGDDAPSQADNQIVYGAIPANYSIPSIDGSDYLLRLLKGWFYITSWRESNTDRDSITWEWMLMPGIQRTVDNGWSIKLRLESAVYEHNGYNEVFYWKVITSSTPAAENWT